MAENSVSGKVSIDVSEALTGLKAVQREAKETVKALKEVETAQGRNGLSGYNNDELFEELLKRVGIKVYVVKEHSYATIKTNGGTLPLNIPGPSTMIIKTDYY